MIQGEDPFALFEEWIALARERDEVESNTLAVATSTPDGLPSVRMVLLKGFDERGFTFFTSYAGRKGRELEANPNAALLFYWPPLRRQVRVEGPVTRVDRAESVAYARSRPRATQLSALASPQSEVVPSREWLEERFRAVDAEHPGEELPVSESWGGFRVEPRAWEFWEHDERRLHDRLRFTREPGGGWRAERLAP